MNLLLIFCFGAVNGLQILKLTRPIDIFRDFALGPIIPRLLHSLNNLDQLLQLLSHPKLPFENIYNKSCGKFIDRERLEELLHWILLDKSVLASVLSQECLSEVGYLVESNDWQIIGRTYPFDEPTSLKLPCLSDHNFIAALREAATRDEKLVQSCFWVCDPSSSHVLLQSSLVRWTGRPDAWSMLHHSCFARNGSIDLVNSNERIDQVITWLVNEVPLEEIRQNLHSEQFLLRWSIHLVLISRNLSNIFNMPGSSAAMPIVLYLKAVANMYRDTCPLLSKLIRSQTAFSKGPFRNLENISLPDFRDLIRAVLQDLTDCLEEQARWFLDTAELYFKIDKDFVINTFLVEDMIRSFDRAPTVVQIHWLGLHLSYPSELQFLDFNICWLVAKNTSLQKYYLSQLDYKSSMPVVNTVFACIPDEVLIKEARWRFISYPGFTKYVSRLSGKRKRTTNITEFVTNYLRNNEDLLAQYVSEKDIESIPEQFMFTAAMADLFELTVNFHFNSGLMYGLVASSKSWLLMEDF